MKNPQHQISWNRETNTYAHNGLPISEILNNFEQETIYNNTYSLANACGPHSVQHLYRDLKRWIRINAN